MKAPVCEVEATGMAMSLQDGGRPGWARFGVPGSGFMDSHAAQWANRLVGNAPGAIAVEILGRGARLKFLSDAWIAITGARSGTAAWRAVHASGGEVVRLCEPGPGLWTYVAVETGFEGPRRLGSASVYARGTLGNYVEAGAVLSRAGGSDFALPAGVSSRVAPWTEQRDYGHPPVLRVWPAPQWNSFTAAQRDHFFGQEWTVSPQSDRAGYRLAGVAIESKQEELLSEPVIAGTVQVPPSGQPIVTMRDGPTVGGYAKLGVVDPSDLPWLTQVQPGQHVRFRPCESI